MKTIHYLFDPLCGWCYAVSNGIARLAQTHRIELIPTGLFCRDKLMTDDWKMHAWENDQRIAKLTGLPFSELYFNEILNKPTNFNSFPLVVALTAVQQTQPEMELTALKAFQKARYELGLDTNQYSVLREVLAELGLQSAVKMLSDLDNLDGSNIQKSAIARIEHGAKLAQLLGVSGVPQVFEELANGDWVKIDSHTLF